MVDLKKKLLELCKSCVRVTQETLLIYKSHKILLSKEIIILVLIHIN
jgi:hypothetical protein